MITERTLRKWRREALVYKSVSTDSNLITELTKEDGCNRQRILRMTQELLDQHLLRKVVR